MIQTLVWPMLWILVRALLQIGKDYVSAAITAVEEAEKQTELTGPQKRQLVFNSLKEVYDGDDWVERGRKITNAILELAVVYVKSKL